MHEGKLIQTMFAGFDVSAATFEASNKDGQFSLVATTSTITVTRANGTTVPNSTRISLRIGNVKNPLYASGGVVDVATRTAADGLFDTGWAVTGASAAPIAELTGMLSTTAAGQ